MVRSNGRGLGGCRFFLMGVRISREEKEVAGDRSGAISWFWKDPQS